MERVTAVLVFVLLTSCGERTSTTTSAPAGEPSTATTASTAPLPASAITPVAGQPCSYVTEAEVSDVFGHPMKFAEAKPGECNLLSSQGDNTKSFSFQILDVAGLYEQATAGPGFEPLSGVGDKAVIAPSTNMVLASKGSRTYMGAAYLGTETAAARQKSTALAQKIVARL